MEKQFINAPIQPESTQTDSLLAEMVLDKAIRDFRVQTLQKEIDQSLLDGNKENFMHLTNELKKYL